jgi:anti-sigma factor (TIGR02949 family)
MSGCVDPQECDDCGKHLYEYQHDELTKAEAQRIRSHLSACPSCMSLYREEEAIRRKLQQCACEAAPEHLKTRIVAFIATLRVTR